VFRDVTVTAVAAVKVIAVAVVIVIGGGAVLIVLDVVVFTVFIVGDVAPGTVSCPSATYVGRSSDSCWSQLWQLLLGYPLRATRALIT
jgi:hypothetical protein